MLKGGGGRGLTESFPQILNGVEVIAHGCGEVHKDVEVQGIVDGGSHADSEGPGLPCRAMVFTAIA